MKKNPNGPGASAPWLAARNSIVYLYGTHNFQYVTLRFHCNDQEQKLSKSKYFAPKIVQSKTC